MRKVLLAVATTAILSATALTVCAAPVSPGGLRDAIEATSVVDHVACWRHGWRGWGRYPCGYRMYRGFRWHRWHWRHRWH